MNQSETGRTSGDERECRVGNERQRRRCVETGSRRGNGDAGKTKWFRTKWKASTWILMVRVATKGGSSKIPEGTAKRQEEKVKKLRARSGN